MSREPYSEARNLELGRAITLIAAGADTNQARSSDGATPRLPAIPKGHDAVTNELIKAGADTNKSMANVLTPLMIAINKRHTKIIQALLLEDNTISFFVYNGTDLMRTCLHESLYLGRSSITIKLIARGTSTYTIPSYSGAMLSLARHSHLHLMSAVAKKLKQQLDRHFKKTPFITRLKLLQSEDRRQWWQSYKETKASEVKSKKYISKGISVFKEVFLPRAPQWILGFITLHFSQFRYSKDMCDFFYTYITVKSFEDEFCRNLALDHCREKASIDIARGNISSPP